MARSRYRREDVVDRALGILAEAGLPDLTMRRLATDLDVQPSALYHHFANKQELLGAVADELLERGRASAGPIRAKTWDGRVTGLCRELRASLLAYPDGADLVATMFAFGLGAERPYADLDAALRSGGFSVAAARTGATTVLHFVHGQVMSEQAHNQAARIGAIEASSRHGDFEAGLRIVIDGLRSALKR